jgi:multiple sugar transport system permease protein
VSGTLPGSRTAATAYVRKEKRLAVLLIVPAVSVICIVMLVPLGYGLLLSLFDYKLGGHGFGKFIFLANYIHLLHDETFLKSLRVTLTFTIGVLLAELSLGILISVLLMSIPARLGKILRAIYTMPLLISPIIVGLAWRYLYDPIYGVVYQFLNILKLGQYFGGLGSAKWALFCVMLSDIWQTTPFVLLVVTAGLAVIPVELYEAGRIDGARVSAFSAYHLSNADAGHRGYYPDPRRRCLQGVRYYLRLNLRGAGEFHAIIKYFGFQRRFCQL